MELLKVLAVILDLGNYVERAGWIDHGCAGDPDLRHDVPGTNVGGGNCGYARGRVDEAGVPKRLAAEAVGIVGIHTVVLGDYIDDVANAD